MSEEEEQESLFSEEAARDVQLIVLMRIYDVLMSEFCLSHPQEGDKLYELHKEGGFLNPTPAYNAEKIVE